MSMMWKTDEATRRQHAPEPLTLSEQLKLPEKERVTMGIKGLTDREGAFPRIGELRKGKKKTLANKPGDDLGPVFRFTSQDESVMAEFVRQYGEYPRELTVFLADQTAEGAFQAWKEQWVAGGLVHRCNGETCIIWRDPAGQMQHSSKSCPGGCKEVGRLRVIIPTLARLAYITVLTSSKYDIINLSEQLIAYQGLRGDLRGIPFRLCRVRRVVSTPMPDGKRARREKWLLSLEPAQEWVQMQIEATRRRALPMDAPNLLDAAEPEPDAENDNGWVEGDGATDPGWSDEADEDDAGQPLPASVQPAPTTPLNGNGKGKKDRQPITSERLSGAISTRIHTYQTQWGRDELCSAAQRGLIVSALESLWGDDRTTAATHRHTVLQYLAGVPSSKLLTKAQASALLDWLIDEKDEETGKYVINAAARQEALAIVRRTLEKAGQQTLPMGEGK